MNATNITRRALLGVAALALVLGAGTGTALALWDDDEQFSAEISSGMVGFAVGRPGATDRLVATGPRSQLGLPLGATEAAALLDTGRVAVGIQVDARADGNKGLEYMLELPELSGNSVLGNSTVRLYRVADAASCTADGGANGTLAATYTPPDADRDGTYEPGVAGWDKTGVTSTAVRADYQEPWTTTQYWCVVATLGNLPDEGSYTNTATVAVEVGGETYTDTDSWRARVATAADPAAEPTPTIDFTHTTTRPGEGAR
jgi:predicted ribosomally synthesized peptide with SipW-like signal peptide